MKLRQFLGEYAAELTFFIFKIAEAMLEPTVRMFIYDGVCLNLYPPSTQQYGVFQHLSLPHQPYDDQRITPNTTSHIPVHLGELDTCGNLDYYPDREAVVQGETANYFIYYKILLNAPAVVLVLFCGAFSDHFGQKLPALLTCLGTVVAVFMYMVSIYIGPGHGAPYLPLFLTGAGVRGLCGRSAVMTMVAHSYASDHSNAQQRTVKISNILAMSHFGYLIGTSAAGNMLDHFGYVWVFLTVIGVLTACTMMVAVCMEEHVTPSTSTITIIVNSSTIVPPPLERRPVLADGTTGSDATGVRPAGDDDAYNSTDEMTPLLGKSNKSTTWLSPASPVAGDHTRDGRVSLLTSPSVEPPLRGTETVETQEVDEYDKQSVSLDSTPPSLMGLLTDSFMFLFQRREDGVRWQLNALFIAIFVQQSLKAGEVDVQLLYVERTPMNMSKTTYGYLLSVSYLSFGLSAFIFPWIFERLLHLGDGTIAVVGLLARMAGLCVLCLSNTTWMVFLAAAISGPYSMTVSCCKSMISKIIGAGDMGKTFSLISFGETVANLVGTAIIANLYAATLNIFAGTAFAAEVVIFVFITFVIGYVGFKQRHLSNGNIMTDETNSCSGDETKVRKSGLGYY